MQASCAAVAMLLCALALSGQVLSVPYGPDTPTACCFSYTSRPVQHKFAVSYFETNSQCLKPAIIFQTKRGRQICANPSEAWVRVLTSTLKQNGSQPGGARVPQ